MYRANNNSRRSSYPLPAYLNFCPGGIRYERDISIHELQSSYHLLGNIADPTALIRQAAQADLSMNNTATGGFGHFVSAKFPSLSLLMEAALHPLTGVPAASVKLWFDLALVEYASLDDTTRNKIASLQQKISANANTHAPRLSSSNHLATASQLLQQLLTEAASQPIDSKTNSNPRPCGYVFRPGDIAWNCRTCQTDSTCVLCDKCFHASDHEGHEVFFHRTNPGGCCDCGDIEAWRLEGCCPFHRPIVKTADVCSIANNGIVDEDGMGADELEAVRSARRARMDTEENLKTLPPTLCTALGVVIGAAIQCVLKAVDGSGVGADISQWKFRWAEQIASIVNGVVHDEEYVLHNRSRESFLTPHTILHLSFDSSVAVDAAEAFRTADTNAIFPSGENQVPRLPQSDAASDSTKVWDGHFPERFRLHLRLHNDDVHTYEEVIDALHKQTRTGATSPSDSTIGGATTDHYPVRLVADHDEAERMTQHVDSDGQATVKAYTKISAASSGFARLKQAGLLCSVVSTPQVDLELRARSILRWLVELVKLHPSVAGIITHALVDVTNGDDILGKAKCAVWCEPRMRAPWNISHSELHTRESLRKLWLLNLKQNTSSTSFYSQVPYRLPLAKFYKSPHALWGTLLSPNDYTRAESMLHYYVIDTDMRKQQETVSLTTSIYPHRLAGLNLVSGVSLLQDGCVNLDGSIISGTESESKPSLIASMLTVPYKELHPIITKASYIAPVCPLLLMLLLDPYPTKQFRSAMHNLWMNLLVDGRFKSRFAAALGTVAYRSLTTLYCAGVGTEQDSPLLFTVQIFTVKSLISALNSLTSTRMLLKVDAPSYPGINSHYDAEGNDDEEQQLSSNNSSGTSVSPLRTRTLPIALSIVRVLHTNILGSTKEVRMLIEHTGQSHHAINLPHQPLQIAHIGGSQSNTVQGPNGYLPALVYQNGENPALDILPAAPDDDFLDSRSTRHKRLPLIMRDLEYTFEAGMTAINLLVKVPPKKRVSSFSHPPPPIMDFCAAFARLLRLTQGMDIQKRKISGGHVEYENTRWFEAFGLSLNLSCCVDALVESPASSAQDIGQLRSGMGNLFTSLIREIKFFLYREEMLESGLLPASYTNNALPQAESLQRSTLHVPCLRSSNAGSSYVSAEQGLSSSSNVALACPTGVKMTEAQLCLIEQALRMEHGPTVDNSLSPSKDRSASGVMMGDWLKVPHSPLSGDPLSFHLPLHRTLAKAILSFCAAVIPEADRVANPKSWWKLPIVDGIEVDNSILSLSGGVTPLNYVAAILAPTLRSSNCKIVWQLPDTSPEHLHMRRLRQYQISSILASVKVIHSLADLPIRCLAAAAQIERHLWTRNGNSVAGMVINYSTAPLCRAFRDLDLCLVQFSAAGFEIGLGSRRVLALLLNRFSMDGYLEDPKFQSPGATHSRRAMGRWRSPPRLQDPEHAPLLAESFFALMCILVTELPPPSPCQIARDASSLDSTLRLVIRRELLHALATEPKSYSEAFKSISWVYHRDPLKKSGNSSVNLASSIRSIFSSVLRTIAKERPSSNSSSAPPVFELSASCSNEYDPTFYHLRRIDHQHAMDVVARLRLQKCTDMAASKSNTGAPVNDVVLPLVPPPPEAHPRFLPARLLLHLPAMDAAIRRKLLYALFGGEWLPPEPLPQVDESARHNSNLLAVSSDEDSEEQWNGNNTSTARAPRIAGDLSRRKNRISKHEFGPRTVQSSSVSSLEVIQLLTLQIHTLESMASLHRSVLGDSLDVDSKELSRSLNVNKYLSRLIYVPESLEGIWALDAEIGPLPSSGSGKCRGSILGVLIALWEHSYSNKSAESDSETSSDKILGMSSSGGARALASDGLKWILRFVHSLVDGATSVKAAIRSATDGIRISSASATTGWTLSTEVQETVQSMLKNVSRLWPDVPAARIETVHVGYSENMTTDSSLSRTTGLASPDNTGLTNADSSSGVSPSNDFKAKLAARKAAQMAAMEKMKKQQAIFAASLATTDDDASDAGSKASKRNSAVDLDAEEEKDVNECIICRCGSQDSDSPLCFLGHVQRSRVLAMRHLSELSSSDRTFDNGAPTSLHAGEVARVVGDNGCQLRVSWEMDSAPVACLPMGSVVLIVESKVSTLYGILSRRVFVRHIVSNQSETLTNPVEGWASVKSSQGYVILAPLESLCFSRWSSTRPFLRLCGHAAHLSCVDSHCLSLQQRAAGDHPYDGRFAANIEEGEFLCPLCKQLSNVLVPNYKVNKSRHTDTPQLKEKPWDSGYQSNVSAYVEILQMKLIQKDSEVIKSSAASREATKRFGDHLYQAMEAPWVNFSQKKNKYPWAESISRWDFEERPTQAGDSIIKQEGLHLGAIMKQLRKLHISWSLLGYGAASSEASARYSYLRTNYNGVRSSWSIGAKVGCTDAETADTRVTDPWTDYSSSVCENHPSLLEAKRIMLAVCGVFSTTCLEIGRLSSSEVAVDDASAISIGSKLLSVMLLDILDGRGNGLAHLLDPSNTTLEDPSCLLKWKLTAGCLASLPCHVARDGALSPRGDARAVATTMWILGGLKIHSTETVVKTLSPSGADAGPPMPLSARKLLEDEHNYSEAQISQNFGTSSPMMYLRLRAKHADLSNQTFIAPPFRPGVASGYLYMPLLAWDLNTYSGAIVSALLHSGGATLEDLLSSAHILLAARIVQALVSPNGYKLNEHDESGHFGPDQTDDFPEFSIKDLLYESNALLQLKAHCLRLIDRSDYVESEVSATSTRALLEAVSDAVLPFARTITLLLRAGFSILSSRPSAESRPSNSRMISTCTDRVVSFLKHPFSMSCPNGFRLIKALGGPLPSELIADYVDQQNCNGWLSMVDRWVTCAINLESHHGSRGRCNRYDSQLHMYSPQYVGGADDTFRRSCLTSTSTRNSDHTPVLTMHRHETRNTFFNAESSSGTSGNDQSSDRAMDVHEGSASDDVNNDIGDTSFAEVFDQSGEDASMADIADNDFMLNSYLGGNFLAAHHEEEFEGEEMTDEALDGFIFESIPHRSTSPSLELKGDDDDIGEASIVEGKQSCDNLFADVSNASIIPFQPSFLGRELFGPGPRGIPLDLLASRRVLYDMSHLGVVHCGGK
jgi:hypothetical protein